MRSIDRRRGQSGASLIEAVVASALLGIGVVGGLTAWDTATISAGKAVQIAWAHCVVRSEMAAILSAPFETDYEVPDQYAAPPVGNGSMQVQVTPTRNNTEQLVTVRAVDVKDGGTVLAQASALKAAALAGRKDINDNGTGTTFDVIIGCPQQ